MAGPRLLLSQLRSLMASEDAPQSRLDLVTKIIATNMGADVCSLYLRRAGDVLELFSTHGLRAESVHQTRLRVGEGLVGDIVAQAHTLALPDAQAHPQFAFRPETGEEGFHSLLGVPLQRGGRVIGALTVQNRSLREYSAEEAEVLQTVAMVLCELVLASSLIGQDELADIDGNATLPMRFEGLPLASGIGKGTVFIHRGSFLVHDLVSDDSDFEIERLERAVQEFLSAVRHLIEESAPRIGDKEREIFDTYQMFAEDEGWLNRIRLAVRDGLTAEGAVQRVQEENRRRLAPTAYFRERIADFDDLSNQLLRHLQGTVNDLAHELVGDAVLVARSLGPAELLEYDHSRLKAIILGEGSPTSHMVLVAKSLNIPVVGRLSGALARIAPGDPVVVDGGRGLVHVRPDDDIYDEMAEATAEAQRTQSSLLSLKAFPAASRDGVTFDMHLNIGLLSELPLLDTTGAAGIGLMRTELLFLSHKTFPSVGDQEAHFRQVFESAGSRPVVFRTFDLGGDKILPNLDRSLEREENPALGWRALRVGLDRPSVLRNQLRALIGASGGRPFSIMFPMVSEIAELDRAREIFELELGRIRQRAATTPSDQIRIGVMIEVPSLAFQLDALAGRVDFVSIGTNDLAQYFFASDRTSPKLANRYDTLAPAFLRLLRHIREQCAAHDIPIAVCGDMSAQPLEAICLAGLGFRALSMPPSAFGHVKKALRSLDCASFEAYLLSRLSSADHTLRNDIRHLAQDRGYFH